MRAVGVASLLLVVCWTWTQHVASECPDYLDMTTWAQSIFDPNHNNTLQNKTIELVLTDRAEDVAECTAERLCHKNQSSCYILTDCFKRWDTSASAKCEKHRVARVHTFHFMCLVARNACPSMHVQGCEHKDVCPLFRDKGAAGSADSAPLSTPAAPATTTWLPKAPSSQATTTTTAATLRHSLSPTRPEKDFAISFQRSYDTNTKLLLILSWSLTFFLPAMVYFVMKRQMRRLEASAEAKLSSSSLTSVEIHRRDSPECPDAPRQDAQPLLSATQSLRAMNQGVSSSSPDVPPGDAASEEAGV